MRRPALIVLLFAVLAGALPSAASARAFTKRFGVNDHGQITMAGNTLMTCPSSCAQANAPANQSTAQASGANLNDNDWTMVPVDADGDAATTSNSSTATLHLPAGAEVLFAGLYWGARTTAGSGGVAADASRQGTARLKVPGGAYGTVTASTVDVATDSSYSAFADVTPLVRAAGDGVYAVGDIQEATGGDRYGGWSLVVAYHDDASPARNLTVFDGFQPISTTGSVGPSSATITVNGFETPPAPAPITTELGAVSYEGDLGSVGDSMKLNGVALTDGVNPATNFFNSTVSVDGTQVSTGRAPAQANHFGFDADMLPAPAASIANGASSATLAVATTSETFYSAVLTFATTLYAPDVRPVTTVTDLNGGAVEPGDVLRYTTTGRNVGTDSAGDLVLSTDVPSDYQLLEDSLRITDGPVTGPQTAAAGDDLAAWDPGTRELTWNLGTGATPAGGGSLAVDGTFGFSFDVRVGAPADGAHVGGPQTAAYTGTHTDYVFETTGTGGSVAVAGPDLAMELTRTGALTRGGTATYALSVANVGHAPSSGVVQVVDELPAGLAFDGTPAGAGWTCATSGQRLTCTRADALAAGDAFPDVTVPVRVTQDAGSPLANAATVSGGSDGVHVNDTDGDSAAADSAAALSLALDGPEDPIAPGDTATLTATVADAGPSDAAGVQVAAGHPGGPRRRLGHRGRRGLRPVGLCGRHGRGRRRRHRRGRGAGEALGPRVDPGRRRGALLAHAGRQRRRRRRTRRRGGLRARPGVGHPDRDPGPAGGRRLGPRGARRRQRRAVDGPRRRRRRAPAGRPARRAGDRRLRLHHHRRHAALHARRPRRRRARDGGARRDRGARRGGHGARVPRRARPRGRRPGPLRRRRHGHPHGRRHRRPVARHRERAGTTWWPARPGPGSCARPTPARATRPARGCASRCRRTRRSPARPAPPAPSRAGRPPACSGPSARARPGTSRCGWPWRPMRPPATSCSSRSCAATRPTPTTPRCAS